MAFATKLVRRDTTSSLSLLAETKAISEPEKTHLIPKFQELEATHSFCGPIRCSFIK